jgi:hypothetical protein
LDDKLKTEIPPWIIPGGLKSYFFVDGSDTYVWSSAASMASNSTINMDNAFGPHNVSMSYIHSPEYNPSADAQHWKRNYHAIYSANYLVHPTEGPVSLGFLHGENKNQVDGDAANRNSGHYQNTIQPDIKINTGDHRTYSGGKPFVEGWNAYNAIISAAWIPNNKQTNWGQQFFQNEIGPIVWPSTGYLTKDRTKCTSGLKHPSSIIHDGYVYVYFADGGSFGHNIPDEEGRQEGIKLVRAPIENALDPASYKVYYRAPDGTVSWLPSLPKGFTKEIMIDFVSVRGPKSTDLMNDRSMLSQEIRFSVAKVLNTDYFIGVEEYIDVADAKKFRVALRFSKDLVIWSDRVLQVYEAPRWEKTEMNYPVFLNSNGWTNTEIDLNDFYILGTPPQPCKSVNRIHIQNPNATTSLTLRGLRSVVTARDLLYPNPNSGMFSLTYTVDTLSDASISVYDVSGRKLFWVERPQKRPGSYIQQFQLQNIPAGVYFIELILNNRKKLYKMIRS